MQAPATRATEPEVRLTRNRPAHHAEINLSFVALGQGPAAAAG